MAKSLKDCLTKAERVGILTDAEMAFVLKRAAELGNERQAITEIHAQRLKEYEAIKEPTAADKVVIQTANENVAMAAYTEEVRHATKGAISPEKKVFEEARAAGEAAIIGAGKPAAAPELLSPDDIRKEIARLKAEVGEGYPGDQGNLWPYAKAAYKLSDGTILEGAAHAVIELPQGYTEDDIIADGFTFGGRFVKPDALTLEGFHKAAIAEALKEGASVSGEVAKMYGIEVPPNQIATPAATKASADADIEAVRSFLVSPQQQGHTVRPTTEQQIQTAMDLGTKLIALHGVGNVKMVDTFSMYQGAHNRGHVTSFDARHDANLTALVQEMAKEAGRTGQDSIKIARVLEPGEDSGNARPGIDIEFKNPIPIERIDDIASFLRARGIDGFDLIPSGYDVATGNPRTFKGLRFEEIPEFSQQPRARKHEILLELQEELMKMEEVASVTHQLYDTLVLTSQDYDKSGLLKRTSGTVRAAAWADRAFNAANPQAARKRSEARAAEAEVSPVEPGRAQEVTTKELETAAALVAAGKASAPVATIVYQDIYRRVVNLMQQNRAALEGMKFTAATDETLRSEKLLRALGELDAMLKYLPAEVRGKVGGYFQLAKVGIGEKALAKFFGDRVRTLERVLEQFLKKQYLGEINDLLDKSKAKTTHGIKKSARMDADAQTVVERALEYSKMDANQVAAKGVALDAEIATAVDEDARIAAERDYAVLNLFGDLSHRSANQLYSAYTYLRDVVETGKHAWKEQAQIIKARNDGRAAEIISVLGNPDIPSLTEAEKNAKTWAEKGGQWVRSHYSFIQFLDHLIPDLSFTKGWMDKTRFVENARTDFWIQVTQGLHEVIQGASSKSWGAFTREAKILNTKHKGAATIAGKPWTLTKLDLIQYSLAWAQEDARVKMEAMGMTPETMAEMENMIGDPISQAVKGYLQKEYARYYDIVNPIYRTNYGVDLPRISFYAPTRYAHATDAAEIAPFGGMVNASGTTAGFMHGRVSHKARMKAESATLVFFQHVSDVSHFIYDAELLREIRGTLMRADVRDAIIQKHGALVWEEAYAWMQAMGKASNTKSNELSAANWLVDSLVTTKAIISLAWNLKSLGMQADSAGRVLYERPWREIARAFMNPAKLAATMPQSWRSPSIQRRIMTGASADVRYIFEKSEFQPSMFLRFNRAGMYPLSWADARLLSISAAISYRTAWNEAKDQGMLDAAAEEFAADKMDEMIYRYAQPTGSYNRSLHAQTGGWLSRIYMLFMTDPVLKTALTIQAVDDLRKGRNVGRAVRWITTGVLFSIVAETMKNAYRDPFTDTDDEDLWTFEGYLRSMLQFPLSGIMILGSGMDMALSALIEGKFLQTSRDFVGEAVATGQRAAKNLDQLTDPDDPKAWVKEVEDLAKSGAMIFGMTPLGPVLAATAGIANMMKTTVGFAENVNED